MLIGPWAIKLPWGWCRSVLRGWLANRSEWVQRDRPEVARPLGTVGHFLLICPRADITGSITDASGEHSTVEEVKLAMFAILVMLECANDITRRFDPDETPARIRDELKPSSWGRFDGVWRLIDFDRCWQHPNRGWVGSLYFGHQERLARKWSRLPRRDVSSGNG